MPKHAAFGMEMDHLDVLVVDASRPMQTILRSMLMSLKVGRIRIFDDGLEALQAMLAEPPHVIISDWHMKPTSGYQLLRMIRHRQMEPLSFVPLIFVTSHGTRAVVERAFKEGAHHLLVKPMSPATLHQRLMWLAKDPRHFVRRGDRYVIEGVEEAMSNLQTKWQQLKRAREYHERSIKQAADVQEFVDGIFNGEISLDDVDIGAFPGAEDAAPDSTHGKASRVDGDLLEGADADDQQKSANGYADLTN